MKILVSSFEPFLEAKTNVSLMVTKELVKDGQNKDIIFVHACPVTYRNSWEHLKKYIEAEKPDVVIALGQAEGSKSIALERWGLNWIESRSKDNDGVALFNQEILKDEAVAFKANIDLEPLYEKLKAAGIPVQISVSAGGFVCNYLYYQLLHAHPKSLFVHLPLTEIPLGTLCQGVQLIINSLR